MLSTRHLFHNIKKTLHIRQLGVMAGFTSCLFLSTHGYADIYFSAKTVGPSSSIYSKSSETSAPIKQITNDNRWRDLAFDVGKNKIVFMSNRHTNTGIDLRKQSEQFNIYLTSTAGGEPQVLANTNLDETYPKLNSSETIVAYTLKEQPQEQLVLLDIETRKPITTINAAAIIDYSWHPQNNQIAIITDNADNTNIAIYDVKKQKSSQIFSLSKKDNSTLSYISWAPNGKNLAFIVNPGKPTAKRQLKLLNLATNKVSPISQPDQEVQSPVSWAPDSKSLTYSALLNYKYYFDETTYKKVYEGEMHIFVADTEGALRQVTTGKHLHNKPEFSPDGKQIAFLFAEDLSQHTAALRIVDLNGKVLNELFKPVHGNSEIVWK
ncbi:hypothetical protein Sde_2273 [Saccharophagus degradans 2-40]|uniref:Translation initiation factor beta propellor-like domain-containing protein n=2 Tax=Saccharophagus degradans TaxID=86304 RepID=Q21IE6_SACD2|nr:hypothetical protein Sde_2273 [Saccharophagus degradans 2-40]